MTISGISIKEWLNQPHKHYKEKNEMLYNLKQVILDSKYMGWTVDSKSREGIVRSHIFETEIADEKTGLLYMKLHGILSKYIAYLMEKRFWLVYKNKASWTLPSGDTTRRGIQYTLFILQRY